MKKKRQSNIGLDILDGETVDAVFGEDDHPDQVSDRACAVCWSITSIMTVLALGSVVVFFLWSPGFVADREWYKDWHSAVLLFTAFGMVICVLSLMCSMCMCFNAFGLCRISCCDCDDGAPHRKIRYKRLTANA